MMFPFWFKTDSAYSHGLAMVAACLSLCSVCAFKPWENIFYRFWVSVFEIHALGEVNVFDSVLYFMAFKGFVIKLVGV